MGQGGQIDVFDRVISRLHIERAVPDKAFEELGAQPNDGRRWPVGKIYRAASTAW